MLAVLSNIALIFYACATGLECTTRRASQAR